jgi:hypothetical protein
MDMGTAFHTREIMEKFHLIRDEIHNHPKKGAIANGKNP